MLWTSVATCCKLFNRLGHLYNICLKINLYNLFIGIAIHYLLSVNAILKATIKCIHFAQYFLYIHHLVAKLQHSAYQLGHSFSYKIACASSEDSDQPVHPHSLIRVFAANLKMLWTPLDYSKNTIWRLSSDCVAAQAKLSLRWAHMQFCLFACVEVLQPSQPNGVMSFILPWSISVFETFISAASGNIGKRNPRAAYAFAQTRPDICFSLITITSIWTIYFWIKFPIIVATFLNENMCLGYSPTPLHLKVLCNVQVICRFHLLYGLRQAKKSFEHAQNVRIHIIRGIRAVVLHYCIKCSVARC